MQEEAATESCHVERRSAEEDILLVEEVLHVENLHHGEVAFGSVDFQVIDYHEHENEDLKDERKSGLQHDSVELLRVARSQERSEASAVDVIIEFDLHSLHVGSDLILDGLFSLLELLDLLLFVFVLDLLLVRLGHVDLDERIVVGRADDVKELDLLLRIYILKDLLLFLFVVGL